MPVLQSLSRTEQRKLTFLSEDAFVTTTLVVFIDMYGMEALQWSPETIAFEIKDDLDVDLPQFTLDKIMTGIALLTTDDFYRRAAYFVFFCNVLSGSPQLPGVFDPADAAECAWGITEAYLFAPPEDDDDIFSPEIIRYIATVLKSEGITNPPDVLRIAGLPPVSYDEASLQDPDLFATMQKTQQEASNNITEMLQDRLRALITQLQTLDLENGETASLVKQMLQGQSS